jgi:hypothetical protein
MLAQEAVKAPSLGAIVSVRGSVVDVRFDEHLPPIYSVLRAGDKGQIVIEVLVATTVRKTWVTTPNFDPARTFKTRQDNKCCVIAARRVGQELIEVTRSYCLGCVAPVKDRRLFNVLGKGASWRVLCSMSQNLSFRIEPVGRLVSLTARIILALRNPNVTVSDLDFRFL